MNKRWRPSVTVAAVIEHEGRFLLVEEHTPEGLKLNNPAGHLEPGETPLAAVVREALEETGREFVPEALLGVYLARFVRPRAAGPGRRRGRGDEPPAPQDITYLRFAYRGRVGEPLPGRELDPAIVRTLWLTRDELAAEAARLRSPLVMRCIDDHLAGQRFALEAVTADASLHEPLVLMPLAQPDAVAAAEANMPRTAEASAGEAAAAPEASTPPAAPAEAGAIAAAAAVAGAAAKPPAKDSTPREPSPAETAAQLAGLFPALFLPGAFKPVKLRIQADIQQRAPGQFTKKQLSIFLHRHTTSTAYIRALVASNQRFDLDGQPAGEVAAEHTEAAKTELERRRQIVMQRRAAGRGPRAVMPRDSSPADAPPREAGAAAAAGEGGVGGDGGEAPMPLVGAPDAADPGARRGPGPGPRPEGPRGPRPERRPQGGTAGRDGRPGRPPQAPRGGQERHHAPAQDRPHDRPQDRPQGGPQDRPHDRQQDKQQDRPPGWAPGRRQDRPPRAQDRAHPRPPQDRMHGAPRPQAPAAPAEPPWPQDPERRERAQLLRSFEGSPLTAANFSALKGLALPQFEALIAQARRERDERAKGGSPAPAPAGTAGETSGP